MHLPKTTVCQEVTFVLSIFLQFIILLHFYTNYTIRVLPFLKQCSLEAIIPIWFPPGINLKRELLDDQVRKGERLHPNNYKMVTLSSLHTFSKIIFQNYHPCFFQKRTLAMNP